MVVIATEILISILFTRKILSHSFESTFRMLHSWECGSIFIPMGSHWILWRKKKWILYTVHWIATKWKNHRKKLKLIQILNCSVLIWFVKDMPLNKGNIIFRFCCCYCWVDWTKFVAHTNTQYRCYTLFFVKLRFASIINHLAYQLSTRIAKNVSIFSIIYFEIEFIWLRYDGMTIFYSTEIVRIRSHWHRTKSIA